MKRYFRPPLAFALFALLAGLAFLPAPAQAAPSVSAGYALSTLVQPSLFQGFHGMKVGPDGKLYLADIYGLTIWRLDLKTGGAEPFVPFPKGMADDLAFAPDGTLAWTNPFTGAVGGRRPDGTIYEIAHGLPFVNGIGFTRSGRLIVSQISPDKDGPRTLVALDPAGKKPPKVILEHAGGINGFRIDKNDVLWGPQGWAAIGLGNLVRVDLKTMAVTVVASGFVTPTGVDLDSKGNAYVVDLTQGTVTRVDPATGAKTLVAQLPPWLDNLTMGPGDQIYVSGTADNTVWQVDAKTGATRAARLGHLALPGGLAMDPAGSGNVYVADNFSYKRVDGKTGAVTDFGHRVGFPMVAGMSVRSGQGKLLLSDVFFGAVRIIDPATHEVVRTIKGLEGPQDAVMLPNGDVLVAEWDAKRIARVAADDAKTTLADGFAGPVGLALDGDSLYVTNAIAGTVTRVDVTTGRKTPLAQGLHQPEGIDRGPDGGLYVVEGDGGGTVLRIDPATGARTEIATGLPIGIAPPREMWPPIQHSAAATMLRLPVWTPNGVAVGDDGAIYVSADKVGALYKLTPMK